MSKSFTTIRLRYYILLILTDGNADDMEYIKDEIIKTSKLPISIVIVGLGDNNFDKMVELDNDKQEFRLKSKYSNGKYERDIVQFVPFREFRSHPGLLEEETLREIPKQFMKFMTDQGIKPKIKKKLNKLSKATLKRQSARLTLAGFVAHSKNIYFKHKEKDMVKRLLNMGFPEDEVAKLIYEGLRSDNELLAIDIFISRGVTLTKGELEKPLCNKNAQDEEKEIQDLYNKQICLKCKAVRARYAVMPCKHVIFCLECARKTSKKVCLLCGEAIFKVVRIFDTN